MNDVLPFVIAGLVSGSVYGLAAVGLVLTFKTSGVFNFAHGAVAAAGAYLFYELHVERGLPWPVAAIVTIGVAGPLMGIALELLSRRLAVRDTVPRVLGTVGLLLVIQGVATAIYGPATRTFPQFLPTSTFSLSGTQVGWDQLIVVLLAATASTALFRFFRSSRLGIAMRGVVDDPSLLAMAGTDDTRVRRTAWIIGASFAVLSGILIAPVLGLEAFILTLLVVQAFGAAAIGRFNNLALTYCGGLVIGVGAALATKYVADAPALAGLPPGLPFMVLFGALLIWPPAVIGRNAKRRLSGGGTRRQWAKPALLAALAAGGAGLAIVPALVGARLPVYTRGLTFSLVFMSLGLLVWTSGQISLCQAAFAAVGASTLAHLTSGAGVPWGLALVLSGLVAVPVGALIAIPAVRLSGIYLALATMGFGLLLERWVYTTGPMFGSSGTRNVVRPALGGGPLSDKGFYYLVLAVVIGVTALMWAILHTRLGLLLRCLADSPLALGTLGAGTTVTLVLVFCIAAFLTAVAGGLFGTATTAVSGTGFSIFDSLFWLVTLAVAGRAVIGSAFVAAALLAVLPSYLPDGIVDHQTLIFGAVAMVAAVTTGTGEKLAIRLQQAAVVADDRVRHSPVRRRMAEATP